MRLDFYKYNYFWVLQCTGAFGKVTKPLYKIQKLIKKSSRIFHFNTTFVFFNIFTLFFVCDTEEIMCVKKHLEFL